MTEPKIKNRSELEEILSKHNIPANWYSFKIDRNKPVCLDNKTVYYGKFGQTYCNNGTEYDVMLEQLLNYQKEQEFYNSDTQKIFVKEIFLLNQRYFESIKIDEDGLITSEVVSHTKEDEELIADGYTYSHFDWYMGWHIYTKSVDSSVFSHIVIEFNKKTTPQERSVYGFSDNVMFTSITYDIPDVLRDKLIKYITENYKKSRAKICDSDLINEIINHFTADKISLDESNNLIKLNQSLREGLYNELIRQKSLNIKDESAFVKALRDSNLERTLFSPYSTLLSRPDTVSTVCYNCAKALFANLENITESELNDYKNASNINFSYDKYKTTLRNQIGKYSLGNLG